MNFLTAHVCFIPGVRGHCQATAHAHEQAETGENEAVGSSKSADPELKLASAAAASAESMPPTIDLSGVEGVQNALSEEELQAACYPFLCWLTAPPMTPCEALVKARRIKTLTQLQPVKNNLRFIFALLHECGAMASASLSALSSLTVCQQLSDALRSRHAGHARLHAIFLLVKKVLVFLSSQESASRKQFVLPSNHSESYLFIDGMCSDSSFRRKQDTRNRALLGVAASRQLQRSQAAAAAALASTAATDNIAAGAMSFCIPLTWSSPQKPQLNTALKAEPQAQQSRGHKVHPPVGRATPGPSQANAPVASSSPTAACAAAASSAAAAEAPPCSSSPPNLAQAMELEVSPNEMSKEELQQVTQGCVQFLQRYSASSSSSSTNAIMMASVSQPAAAAHDSQHDTTPQSTPRVFHSHDIQAAAAAASNAGVAALQASTQVFTASHPTLMHRSEGEAERQPDRVPEQPVADHVHMAYLVTALLCLCMAPRSQVLRQLRIGSSLVKEADEKYWVRLLADMCKNGKPTLFAVPELLTPAMDYYLQHVRPRMIARQAPQKAPPDEGAAAAAGVFSPAQPHDFVFCKTNGAAPRAEFSTCTSLVTMQLIGRPINAHAFRSAVITTFYSTNASQADMDTLANIMSHDAATARNFYYRPGHIRAAERTAQHMMAQLLSPVEPHATQAAPLVSPP